MPKHRILCRLLAGLGCVSLLAGVVLWGTAAALPDTFYTPAGEASLRIASMPWVSAVRTSGTVARAGNASGDKSRNVTLALLGVIPLKTVRTVERETRSVQACGTPFGVKMFSDGALVVAVCWDRAGNSRVVPAAVAGSVVYLNVTTSGPVMILVRAR